MAVAKKKSGLEHSVKDAMTSASKAITKKAEKTGTSKGRKPQAGILFNFRIDPIEKESWTETFNEYGMTLSAGIKSAVYYVIQELKAGRLEMKKNGAIYPSAGGK